MDRFLYKDLCEWKSSVRRIPLKTFIDNNPELKGVRFSMKDYVDQGWMVNIPLYAVNIIDNIE